jgi:hypothetical protein
VTNQIADAGDAGGGALQAAIACSAAAARFDPSACSQAISQATMATVGFGVGLKSTSAGGPRVQATEDGAAVQLDTSSRSLQSMYDASGNRLPTFTAEQELAAMTQVRTAIRAQGYELALAKQALTNIADDVPSALKFKESQSKYLMTQEALKALSPDNTAPQSTA